MKNISKKKPILKFFFLFMWQINISMFTIFHIYRLYVTIMQPVLKSPSNLYMNKDNIFYGDIK